MSNTKPLPEQEPEVVASDDELVHSPDQSPLRMPTALYQYQVITEDDVTLSGDEELHGYDSDEDILKPNGEL